MAHSYFFGFEDASHSWIQSDAASFLPYYKYILVVDFNCLQLPRVCVDGHSQTLVPAKLRSCVTSQPCLTSPWTQWEDGQIHGCPHGRRGVKRLTRRRKIDRLPQGSGRACPHLVEYRLMNAGNITCPPKCLLVASGWSQCRVADINGEAAICGGGLQDRNVSCLSNEGRRPVDLSFCSHLSQLPRVQR